MRLQRGAHYSTFTHYSTRLLDNKSFQLLLSFFTSSQSRVLCICIMNHHWLVCALLLAHDYIRLCHSKRKTVVRLVCLNEKTRQKCGKFFNAFSAAFVHLSYRSQCRIFLFMVHAWKSFSHEEVSHANSPWPSITMKSYCVLSFLFLWRVISTAAEIILESNGA